MTDIKNIMKVLPHAYPFLLIDRIKEYESNKFAVATKNVTINEPYFCGHFPNNPIMPGVLILEAMAQTGAYAILSEDNSSNNLAIFTGVKNAKFRKKVIPGDVLTLKATLTNMRNKFGVAKCFAYVEENLVAEAEISFIIQQD